MKLGSFAPILLLLYTAARSGYAHPAGEPAREIIPGRSAGAVERASTERDLVEAYGHEAVQAGRIELGEGESAPGTLLFPEDSTLRMEIIWETPTRPGGISD